MLTFNYFNLNIYNKKSLEKLDFCMGHEDNSNEEENCPKDVIDETEKCDRLSRFIVKHVDYYSNTAVIVKNAAVS